MTPIRGSQLNVETTPISLRFQFDLTAVYRGMFSYSNPSEGLSSVLLAIQGMADAVRISNIIEQYEAESSEQLALANALATANQYVDSAQVSRIRKESPLELVLNLPGFLGGALGYTAGAIAGAYAIAQGAIRLHASFQEARVQKARADAQVAYLKLVTDQLKLGVLEESLALDAYRSVASEQSALASVEAAAIRSAEAFEGVRNTEIIEG